MYGHTEVVNLCAHGVQRQIMPNDSPGDLVLTYRELGERLGIEPDSARARARRRGWRVVLDNHGIARVHVPPSELPDEPPERGVRTGNGADAEGYVQGTLAELSTHLARALDEVREERARVEAVQAREVEARIALARTEAERDGLRLVVARLEADLDWARRPWWRRWLAS
jgi:hypothetical protein